MKNKSFNLLLIAVVTVVAVWSLWPTWRDYSLSQHSNSFHSKKNNVVEFHVKKKQTRQEIEHLGNRISNKGSMSIATKYNKGWRSGYFSDFGDNVELYNPDM